MLPHLDVLLESNKESWELFGLLLLLRDDSIKLLVTLKFKITKHKNQIKSKNNKTILLTNSF